MMNKNYDRELQKIIDECDRKNIKPKLLLHACCAPCSTACIERVKDFFDLTVYFYNPNMDSEQEYNTRLAEQERLCDAWKINLIKEGYCAEDFNAIVGGLESQPEGGARCVKCFELRLTKTAEKAKELGFDYFTTTLTVSPLKNADLLNKVGEKVAETVGVKFLPTDFKKKNGYKRSVELSKEFSLYRQNYCGCIYSKNER
jgi:predicted adenine nucleotide alpha hydrolase (AANH) superfamily ATPase